MRVFDKARASGCEGKKKYSKKADAKKYAKRLSALKGYDMLYPYHCVFCGQYHLGHKVPQKVIFINKDNIDSWKKRASQADRKA